MTEENRNQAAREALRCIGEMLDALNFTYETDDRLWTVRLTLGGDEMPVPVCFEVRPELSLVRLTSFLPFPVAPAALGETCLAMAAVNSYLMNGGFEYHTNSERIYFRMAQPYHGSVLTKETCRYMLGTCVETVTHYNGRFSDLAGGAVSFEEFLRREIR